MRTGTLEGPAASEEASQYPVLFDTLEYRQQNPERVLFPKCRKGGQASILPERSESGKPGQWMFGRTVPNPSQGGCNPVRFTRGTGWGKPQGGGIPGEPGRRSHQRNPVADVPTGWRMKPLKRGRRGIKPRRGCCSRTIVDPGHCRLGRNAAPTGGCEARRKVRGRPLPEEMCTGGNPGSSGLLPADRTANRKRGCTAERWSIPVLSSSVGRTP